MRTGHDWNAGAGDGEGPSRPVRSVGVPSSRTATPRARPLFARAPRPGRALFSPPPPARARPLLAQPRPGRAPLAGGGLSSLWSYWCRSWNVGSSWRLERPGFGRFIVVPLVHGAPRVWILFQRSGLGEGRKGGAGRKDLRVDYRATEAREHHSRWSIPKQV